MSRAWCPSPSRCSGTLRSGSRPRRNGPRARSGRPMPSCPAVVRAGLGSVTSNDSPTDGLEMPGSRPGMMDEEMARTRHRPAGGSPRLNMRWRRRGGVRRARCRQSGRRPAYRAAARQRLADQEPRRRPGGSGSGCPAHRQGTDPGAQAAARASGSRHAGKPCRTKNGGWDPGREFISLPKALYDVGDPSLAAAVTRTRSSGNGMNSLSSPGTVPKRIAFQSCFACSMRSREEATKFQNR